MFGFYQTPECHRLSVQRAKLFGWANVQEGGQTIQRGLMGALSAIKFGWAPAVAAPLAGALL